MLVPVFTMKIHTTFNWALLAYLGCVTAYVVTAGVEEQNVATSVKALITASDLLRVQVPAASTFVTSPLVLQVPSAAASITTAPTNTGGAYVVRRQTQKCFNDQGFQVDCATWTGYYCTFPFSNLHRRATLIVQTHGVGLSLSHRICLGVT